MTRLSRLNLNGCHGIQHGLQHICGHDLVELDISDCQLGPSAWQHLQKLSGSLLSLNIHGCNQLMMGVMPEYFLMTKLRALDIGNTNSPPALLKQLILPLVNLTSLDVSQEVKNGDLTFLDSVKDTLRSLILFDCKLSLDSFLYICQMKALRHLDISQDVDVLETVTSANVLPQLIANLPNLVSLDVSGTDIAFTENYVAISDDGKKMKSRIAGLTGLTKPLEFLGLLDSSACEQENIPALKVSGQNDEQQILTALEAYVTRTPFFVKALNSLFDIARVAEIRNPYRQSSVLWQEWTDIVTRQVVQISGSASLYHLTKRDAYAKLGHSLRRKSIVALINAMENLPREPTLQRNACLTLCNFKVPEELEFVYERVARQLLRLATDEMNDDFIQKVAVYLCNAIVCQVDGVQKQLVGKIGVVKTMLKLIKERLENRNCDEVMEIAWSTLWNVTDETAENCQMFLEGNGMQLFLSCYSTFPGKPELLRNMMGLLGNVSEVRELREELIKYANVFSDLLDNHSDGIEVSYNAAGVLSHIASDGIEVWNPLMSPIDRNAVLTKMVEAIDSWDLNAQRNINYRSFEPILRLVSCYHTPQVQLWAVWALANLTTVYRKSCS
ncbi:LOW QUALITY PROTEIN: protein zer-1 homolog [Ptychodera flava]|uniref:LOW QUALITY PROTEIN: protein zer-1 homolog n=1 Tax=Ptychodera flava TaxID=63121 RepID=UPI00396A55B7